MNVNAAGLETIRLYWLGDNSAHFRMSRLRPAQYKHAHRLRPGPRVNGDFGLVVGTANYGS